MSNHYHLLLIYYSKLKLNEFTHVLAIGSILFKIVLINPDWEIFDRQLVKLNGKTKENKWHIVGEQAI